MNMDRIGQRPINPPQSLVLSPRLDMDPKLVFQTPPPLHPDWLAHEKEHNLLAPKPMITDPALSQKRYSDTCKALNAGLLAGRDKHLTENIIIQDRLIEASLGSSETHHIPIREYNPLTAPNGQPELPFIPGEEEADSRPTIVYIHGGGLYNGDLDSEDLTCRRICKSLQCKVYSCTYRKMPQSTADDALSDAMRGFQEIATYKRAGKLILVGSSSGGQLVGQISQRWGTEKRDLVDGVLLRGPVTCNATEGGKYLPERFKALHTSMSKAFHTSLLSGAAVTNDNRTTAKLPLEEEDLSGMPRHWIQVCTNDVYYSDGACYAEALREAGVEVRLDVLEGWPHTFWAKAPYLERAVRAEDDMIEGLKWLLVVETEIEGEENTELY